MVKKKFKASLFFKDSDGVERFLFRIINYGKETDELKFTVKHPDSQNVVIYNKDSTGSIDEAEIRKYGEISYHSDGSLLWKLPNTKDGQPQIRNNVNDVGDRRTPLAELREWEPVFRGNIIRYANCTPGLTEDARIIPPNANIFNGEPFEYCVMFGNMAYASPPNHGENEMLFRVNDIAENIDMIVWLYKSDYYGENIKIGDLAIWGNNNRIQIAERKIQVNTGAIEIDLSTLRQPQWNGDLVDDHLMLNLDALRHQPPLISLCKVYLKHNPYLRQLVDLIGYNKTVAVKPLFNRKYLGIELAGLLDKDDKGEFFGIGTPPDV